MSTVEAEKPVSIEEFNVLDPKVQACPYPYYKELRSQCPVFQSPQTGMYYVTKYEDIRFIKKHPEIFSSDITHKDRVVSPVMEEHDRILHTYGWDHVQVLQRTDPPQHNRWRQLIDRTFTASRVRKMKDYIDENVNALIDNWIDKGECDFVTEFAIPLPCVVIADQLGLPREQFWKLKEWSDAMLEPGGLMATDEEILRCAWSELEAQHFFYKTFEDRRGNPQDDIMSDLINIQLPEDEPPLSMHELQNLMHQLLTGGNETTTSALAHGLWNLLKYPEQMKKLQEDRSLVKNFVEETLRFETPVLGLFRKVVQDTELSGEKVPAGSMIFMAYGSANRDEEKFDEGEEFDITRKNAGAQIAFGMGAHFCPGAMLARQELHSTFEILLDRITDIELARPLPEETHEPSIFLHQLKELPIKFRKL